MKPLKLMHATERLKQRYVDGEIDLSELEILNELAILHNDPVEHVRPGGIEGPSKVCGEIEALGTRNTVILGTEA